MTEAEILRQVRWPSPRAVSFAMQALECDEATAIAELVELRVVISEVRRALGWTLEQAAIAVIRLEPVTPPLMARHGLTKPEAIIELLRAGA
jgi:hypothetical protein